MYTDIRSINLTFNDAGDPYRDSPYNFDELQSCFDTLYPSSLYKMKTKTKDKKDTGRFHKCSKPLEQYFGEYIVYFRNDFFPIINFCYIYW